MNHPHKTFTILLMFFAATLFSQTYCMHNPDKIRLNKDKLYFGKLVPKEEGSEEVYLQLGCELPLDPKKNFFKPEGAKQAYIVITPNDIRSVVPFSKFFGGDTEKDLIIQDAIKEYKSKMPLYQQYPLTAMFTSSIVSAGLAVGAYAWWLKK